MIAPLAQLLILMTRKTEEEKTPKQGPYRMKCLICDDMGKDAREPCIGHDMAVE